MNIRRSGAKFAEERRAAIERLGIELNRDFLRCNLT
jgi:hypothetical protein